MKIWALKWSQRGAKTELRSCFFQWPHSQPSWLSARNLHQAIGWVFGPRAYRLERQSTIPNWGFRSRTVEVILYNSINSYFDIYSLACHVFHIRLRCKFQFYRSTVRKYQRKIEKCRGVDNQSFGCQVCVRKRYSKDP